MLPTVLSSENQITGNAKRVSSSLIPLYTQKRTPANLGFLLTTAITRISKLRSLIYFDFFLSLLLIRCLIKAARVVGGDVSVGLISDYSSNKLFSITPTFRANCSAEGGGVGININIEVY